MTIKFIPAKNKTVESFLSPERRKYELIVIHWTACTFQETIRWFQSPNNNVSSAHYVISNLSPNVIIQMVSEIDIAWHAGYSAYKNYDTYDTWRSLNPCSIGIELVGPPSIVGDDGWRETQIAMCAQLCREIAERHPGIKLIDHWSICARARELGWTKDVKIDVIKGTGKPQDIFPWETLLKLSGLDEA
jgi:N-acetyl-anhydromuramyl-L-alanine amidase AmpD